MIFYNIDSDSRFLIFDGIFVILLFPNFLFYYNVTNCNYKSILIYNCCFYFLFRKKKKNDYYYFFYYFF